LREQELAALAAQLASRPEAADVAAAEARVQTLQAELEGLIASQRDHLAALESLQRERESVVQTSQAQEKLVAESLRAQAEREQAVAAKLEGLFADRTAAEDRLRQQHLQELDHERRRYESLLAQGNGTHDALQQQLRDANTRLDVALREAVTSQRQLLTVSDQHAQRLEAWRQAADEGSARHAATLERTHGRHLEQLEAYRVELGELRATREAATTAADERLRTFIAREKEQRDSFESLQQALIASHERHLSQAAQQHREEREAQARLASQALEERERAQREAAERVQLSLISSHERLLSQTVQRHREERDELRQRLSITMQELLSAQELVRRKEEQLRSLSSSQSTELQALQVGWQEAIANQTALQERLLATTLERFELERTRLLADAEVARSALASALQERERITEQATASERSQASALEAAHARSQHLQSSLEATEAKLADVEQDLQRWAHRMSDAEAQYAASVAATQQDLVQLCSQRDLATQQLDIFRRELAAMDSHWTFRFTRWLRPVEWESLRPSHFSHDTPHQPSPVRSQENHPDSGNLASASCSPYAISKDSFAMNDLNSLLELQGRPFVEAAYRLLLKRSADPSGMASHLHQLRRGIPKSQILLLIAESPEGITSEIDHVPGMKALLDAARKQRPGRLRRIIMRVARALQEPVFQRLEVLEEQLDQIQQRLAVDHGILEQLLSRPTYAPPAETIIKDIEPSASPAPTTVLTVEELVAMAATVD
jgi:hypothetical protein